MAKVLTFVVALAGLAWVAYYASHRPVDPTIVAPTDKLERARAAAKRIETENQQYVDDVEKKSRE